MDDKRFDHLVKLIGRGASRRSILKGLLGIGGAAAAGAVISDDANARARISRPTIPPPPPPTTTTTTTTAAPCPAGEQQCPNSTVCCPTGTCARSGNAAICCDGTDGNGDVVCGLDCCDIALECCDGECCPSGTVCLVRVFGEGPFVEEEVCCPIEDTCRDIASGEGLCCDGECFDPEGGVFPAQALNPDFECCPAGGTLCDGILPGTLCCQGDTPQCCLVGGITAVCIAADACCDDADCPGACDVCYDGQCVDSDQQCTGCDVCYQGQCVSECLSTEVCCEREVQGVPIEPVCIDPLTQCCTNPDCFEEPFNFDRGCVACPATGPNAFTCDPRNEGEQCGGAGECDICYQGQCLDTPCPTTTTVAPTTTTTFGPTTTTTCPPETKPCPNGSCIPTSQCCEDCTLQNDPSNCVVGFCTDNGECVLASICPAPATTCCGNNSCQQCCGADTFFCTNHGFDPGCAACEGGNCVPADDETDCVLEDESSGTCCGGLCVAAASCTTTTAAPTTTTCPPETKPCPNGTCIGIDLCCTDCSELTNPAECLTGFCTGGGFCEAEGCGPSDVCCGGGACQECCGSDVSNCPGEGIDVDCGICNNGNCEAANAGGECGGFGFCNGFGVCLDCLSQGDTCNPNAESPCCPNDSLFCDPVSNTCALQ